MFASAASAVSAFTSLTPLAIIGMLAYSIYLLVQGKQQVSGVKGQVAEISDNHLHEVADELRDISTILQRMEVSNSENFAYLKAKLNGGPRS